MGKLIYIYLTKLVEILLFGRKMILTVSGLCASSAIALISKDTYILYNQYEENNSVITLIYSALPSQRFLLHDGNKLYYVYGYLNKTERKVCCGLRGC